MENGNETTHIRKDKQTRCIVLEKHPLKSEIKRASESSKCQRSLVGEADVRITLSSGQERLIKFDSSTLLCIFKFVLYLRYSFTAIIITMLLCIYCIECLFKCRCCLLAHRAKKLRLVYNAENLCFVQSVYMYTMYLIL